MTRFRVTIEGNADDHDEMGVWVGIGPKWDADFLKDQINTALNSFMYLDNFQVVNVERITKSLSKSDEVRQREWQS